MSTTESQDAPASKDGEREFPLPGVLLVAGCYALTLLAVGALFLAAGEDGCVLFREKRPGESVSIWGMLGHGLIAMCAAADLFALVHSARFLASAKRNRVCAAMVIVAGVVFLAGLAVMTGLHRT